VIVTAAGREGESVGVCDGGRDFAMVGWVGGGRLGVLDKASSPRGGASLGAGSETLGRHNIRSLGVGP
jgi:hypothetical protein